MSYTFSRIDNQIQSSLNGKQSFPSIKQSTFYNHKSESDLNLQKLERKIIDSALKKKGKRLKENIFIKNRVDTFRKLLSAPRSS